MILEISGEISSLVVFIVTKTSKLCCNPSVNRFEKLPKFNDSNSSFVLPLLITSFSLISFQELLLKTFHVLLSSMLIANLTKVSTLSSIHSIFNLDILEIFSILFKFVTILLIVLVLNYIFSKLLVFTNKEKNKIAKKD